MIQVIVLNQNGSSDVSYINENSDIQTTLGTIIRTKGYNTVQKLHIWKQEEFTYHLYGYTNGEVGIENKHELPPPIENNLYYGDIVVCLTDSWSLKPLHLNYELWIDFYTKKYGGFDDLESSSELSDINDMQRYHSSEDSDYVPEEESYDYSSDIENSFE